MNKKDCWKFSVLVVLCSGGLNGPALAADVSRDVPTFTREGRELRWEMWKLQLSEGRSYGIVAKCGPVPKPDGCPLNCPGPLPLQALQKYAEGRTRSVAVVLSASPTEVGTWGSSVICDPRPVREELNKIVLRVTQFGSQVTAVNRSGIKISSTPSLDIAASASVRNTAMARGFDALTYIDKAITNRREPSIRMEGSAGPP